MVVAPSAPIDQSIVQNGSTGADDSAWRIRARVMGAVASILSWFAAQLEKQCNVQPSTCVAVIAAASGLEIAMSIIMCLHVCSWCVWVCPVQLS